MLIQFAHFKSRIWYKGLIRISTESIFLTVYALRKLSLCNF